MAEAKEQPKEGEAPAKPKGKKKLIIILVVVLLLAGGGGFFLLKGGGEEESAEKKEEETTEARVVKRIKLDTMIVNLSEAKSFLKVSMLLEYDPEVLAKVAAHGAGEGHGGGGSGGGEEAEGGFPGEMLEKEPVVKDAILRVLSSKTPAELLTVTGKQTLKDELIETINETLEYSEPVIINIYFTEFIIQ